jgi:hypothetical protein
MSEDVVIAGGRCLPANAATGPGAAAGGMIAEGVS